MTRHVAIILASLSVLAVAGYGACVAYDGSHTEEVVDEGVEVPGVGVDADPIRQPRVRGDIRVDEGVLSRPEVELQRRLDDPALNVPVNVYVPATELDRFPPPEAEACGATICSAAEHCCASFGRCVPADCTDCCVRLARGEEIN